MDSIRQSKQNFRPFEESQDILRLGPIWSSFAERILDATVRLTRLADESTYLTIEIVLNLILPAV